MKKLIRAISLFLSFVMLIVTFWPTIHASAEGIGEYNIGSNSIKDRSSITTNSKRVIILHNLEELNRYNGADGVYTLRIKDGRCLRITIDTATIFKNSKSAKLTEYVQQKTYNYELMTTDGKTLDWSSKLVGVFHFTNKQVWCTSGIAYHEFGTPEKSSISYSENTYSSAKVTDVSKYTIKAKITTPTGTYNISQYVGSDPTGKILYNISY